MKNRYGLFFATTLFATFCFMTFGSVIANAAPRVIRVSLAVERLARVSTCPTTVDFRGSITMDGPGTVRYTFERSDHATGPIQSIYFAAAGTQDVRTSWTLGRTYAGYQKLVVLSPNRMVSPETRFNLTCEGGTLEEPPMMPTSSVDVFCPMERARTEITSRLPEGWWQTPQEGRLLSLGVLNVGGERTLACYYGAYGTRAAVMRRYPEGKTVCTVTGTNRFTCR